MLGFMVVAKAAERPLLPRQTHREKGASEPKSTAPIHAHAQ